MTYLIDAATCMGGQIVASVVSELTSHSEGNQDVGVFMSSVVARENGLIFFARRFRHARWFCKSRADTMFGGCGSAFDTGRPCVGLRRRLFRTHPADPALSLR
ncbi:hypothetical protein [Sphingomonas sp. DBB INV C78]|uniref:hypothetical protein n=1 Tax=Sphingomonas sp. DBB INV C78 TaxID=3349434 RepID=UPI0036D2BA33